MIKRWIAVMLCVTTVFTMSGCGFSKSLSDTFSKKDSASSVKETKKETGMKVGLLLAGDGTAPDSVARIGAIRKTQSAVGLTDSQVYIRENVTRDNCAEQIKELASAGCSLIFSTDKSFESQIVDAAEKYTKVQFCQEGGEQAKQSKLSNMHDYYSKIYEAYYISGVLAGMKLNHLIEEGKASTEPEDCMIGFVASEESARVISAYTAFLLGVRQEQSNATMLVRYVGSEGVYDDDGEAANQLATAGVKIMSTFTSTNAVATVCAEHDIPVVGNENSVIDVAPQEAITSVITDWSVYYTYAIDALKNNREIDTDWCGGYHEEVVRLSQLNDSELADGMAEEAVSQEKRMRNGKIDVFDLSKFTVEEESLEDKLSSKKYKTYKGYVSDNVFLESERNSAPAFDIMIDGITVTTQDYVGELQQALEEAQESMEEE